jgi:hypothetical protein
MPAIPNIVAIKTDVIGSPNDKIIVPKTSIQNAPPKFFDDACGAIINPSCLPDDIFRGVENGINFIKDAAIPKIKPYPYTVYGVKRIPTTAKAVPTRIDFLALVLSNRSPIIKIVEATTVKYIATEELKKLGTIFDLESVTNPLCQASNEKIINDKKSEINACIKISFHILNLFLMT